MKPLKKNTKILLIAAAVAVLVLFALLLLFLPELIQPALWTLLLLGVGFFLVEFYFRRKRKKKQKDFDEKVSAKEGIEDRRREWAGWIEELERQGIDRYELPFYLIVGEPQSGKSVLLQNSDLYFPFGQERLSGVGGTRGCDWWFTDEAVILDIAGRLFTHEGGVADKLEWESFLDLLNNFRPMCPANGVLLVVPCDALLADTPEVCSDKANKIQSALLTLTQKLQAQLPVYLVLTKGDRVFGFAESVHRLDGEERHQMFGWSREADRVDKPFELEEAKAGFARLVDRARLLRERMIASARLPEALPEIDRMYAFPDELNGLYRSLEIYLKRIFTQSSLVERASFRGIYLTSGLQTGAPVARVCAELLGGNRDSDARALESLFSHQRAYFIKDLVRKRVFAERGLVRPTEGRVLSARRTALVGYGAAAALAAAAIIGSAVHLLREGGSPAEGAFAAALDAGRSAVARAEVGDLLRDLHTVHLAVVSDRALMQEMFQSTRDGFERLYTKICDRALAPVLRLRLEEAILQRAQQEPSSHEQFVELLDAATLLYADLEFGGKDAQALVKKWLPGDWTIRVADAAGNQVEWTVADALKLHGGSGPVAKIGDRSRLDPLARRLLTLLDRSVDPATPWMAQGHFGFMIAWYGAQEAWKYTHDTTERPSDEFLERCDLFANAVDCMGKMLQGPKLAAGMITNQDFVAERRTLAATWALLTEFTTGQPAPDWPKLTAIDRFARPIFKRHESNEVIKIPLFTGVLYRFANKFQQDTFGSMLAKVPIHEGEVEQWLKDPTQEMPAYRTEPKAKWDLRSMEGVLGRSNDKLGAIYSAKVKVMAAQFATRFPDWARARAGYYRDGASAPAADQLDQALLAALAGMRKDMALYKLQDSPAAQHVSKLMEEHLRAIDTAWATRNDWGTKIDWSIPTSLTALAAMEELGGEVEALADRLRWAYLAPHEGRLLREWREYKDGKENTTLVLAALNEHLARLEGIRKAAGEKAGPLNNPEHSAWLAKVDDDLAGRLQKHVDVQLRFWRPDTSGWVSLAAAVEGVTQALEAGALRTKIREARKVESPPADAAEFRKGQPVAETTELPETTKKIEALRGFTLPSDTDVRNHKIATQVRAVASKVQDQLTAGNDQRSDQILAATALEMAPLPAATPPLTTVDHYLRPLHEVLRKRLVEEVRSRYLRALSKELLKDGSAVMDALYASKPEAINGIDDSLVLPRLSGLLDPRGRLNALRAEYRMLPDAKDPTKPHLRPPEDFVPPDAEKDWWLFERFLVALQAFLVRGEATVETAGFLVLYEVPKRAAGPVWDIQQTPKQFVYFAAHSAGKENPGSLIYDRGWGNFEKPLRWEVNTTRPPRLWIVWTNTVRTQTFQWPLEGRDAKEDLSFELTGSLAPLLLAWSGVEDGAGWMVQFEPKNTSEKAKLRLSFQGLTDKVALVLPPRPLRPTPF